MEPTLAWASLRAVADVAHTLTRSPASCVLNDLKGSINLYTELGLHFSPGATDINARCMIIGRAQVQAGKDIRRMAADPAHKERTLLAAMEKGRL
jgi:hypothetical protein